MTAVTAGILLSAAGAVGSTVPVLIAIRHRLRRRARLLTGFWFQATYDVGDNGFAGDIWSIELLQIKQNGENIHGWMWRIYPYFFDRCWHFDGRFDGRIVRVLYDADAGDGGDGLLRMIRLNDGQLVGEYGQALLENAAGRIHVDQASAPMEWLRLSLCTGDELRDWLRLVTAHGLLSHLPHRARRVLPEWQHFVSLKQRVTHTSAASGSPLALAHLMAVERDEARKRAAVTRRLLEHAPRLRRPDMTGVPITPLHPKERSAEVTSSDVPRGGGATTSAGG